MSLEIRKDSLFSFEGAIGHGVNSVGKMGAGIAVHFKKAYPDMFAKYAALCDEGKLFPGMVMPWVEEAAEPVYAATGQLTYDRRVIYNMVIKGHWKNPASYEALKTCLGKVKNHATRFGIQEVALPWIGCGHGQLSKESVRKLIESFNQNSDFRYIIYDIPYESR